MGETCTQYISLTAENLKGLNMDETGDKYVCSPPPRDPDSWEAIWNGIQTGVFQTFSSDHCPFYFEGEMGKKNPKARTAFRWVPNGIPGVEVRMPILFSEGVVKGRISLNKFVALTSTNHARIYGLRNKGSIAPGCDADIVLWDAEREVTISQTLMHHGADYTPWEGYEVTGWLHATILRGAVVMQRARSWAERRPAASCPERFRPWRRVAPARPWLDGLVWGAGREPGPPQPPKISQDRASVRSSMLRPINTITPSSGAWPDRASFSGRISGGCTM